MEETAGWFSGAGAADGASGVKARVLTLKRLLQAPVEHGHPDLDQPVGTAPAPDVLWVFKGIFFWCLQVSRI